VLAVISLDFDPTVSPLGLPVRLETLVLAAVVLLVMVLIAIRAGRARPVGDDAAPATGRRSGRLRRDDLILLAFGAVPGAIVGGRLGYGLIHFDFYSVNQGALLDPAGGGLGLTLAVAIGTVSAMAVARLLSAPVGRWLGVARGPVLLGLGLGKLATLLGGAGQGAYSNSPWATSYAGPGPWESLNAGYAALPSQALEGVLVLVALGLLVVGIPALASIRVEVTRKAIVIGLRQRGHTVPRGEGRGFAIGLIFWAIARFVAAFTWRDAQIVGPLNGEQLVLSGFVCILLVIVVAPSVRRGFHALIAARPKADAEKPAQARSDTGATTA
jgi:prolipoprotein diacylglyceryltransferase